MTADLTPEDLDAIGAAEDAAEREEDAVDPPAASRWTAAPTDLVWPVTPEDRVLHTAAVTLHLAERQLDAEEP